MNICFHFKYALFKYELILTPANYAIEGTTYYNTEVKIYKVMLTSFRPVIGVRKGSKLQLENITH